MQVVKRIVSYSRTLIIGVILGLANVIPGVSGGTMAVVFGIYPQLLALMALDVKAIAKQVWFFLLLAAGIGLGIVGFSQIMGFLLERHPMPTNYFFIGVIVGSLPMLWHWARGNGKAPELGTSVACVLALGVMLALPLLQNVTQSQAYLEALTPWSFARVFFGGALAAIAMIIPGISGSLILVILGLYATVIGAVSDFARMLPVWFGLSQISGAGDRAIFIIPAGLGIAAGLVFGGRLVRWLLDRYPRMTYGAILGLVAGSPFAIYPGFSWNATGLVAILFLVGGAALTLLFSRSKEA
ncbi:MAG TPA: DUF368 domain-containing protein [Clostridia bacterium]|nr:DUF368 domain-containing protein [Clostridia bacterium]